MNKTINNILRMLIMAFVAVSTTAALQSCDDESTYDFDSNLHSFGPSPASRGESIRIIGTGLSGVDKVIFPVGIEVSDFVSKNDSEIVVNVPQEAVPGRIQLVMGSKVITSKAILTFAEPITIESVTAANATLLAGDEVVVKGEYLYNVASVTFGNNAEVTADNFVAQSRKELRVKVPAEAKSGKITFSDGNDWTYSTEEEYAVATADVTGLSATELTEGGHVTINGHNLQLVKAIYFPVDIPATAFTVNANGTAIDVTVPHGIASGTITLELYSLDRISTPEFKIPTISYTSITPATDIVAGTELLIKGGHLNLVTSIVFPGNEVITTGWTVNADGSELRVAAPASIVDGRITLVQNANVSVDTDPIATKKAGNIFWTGSIDLGAWSQNFEIGKDRDWEPEIYEAFNAAITGPGKLTINFEEDSTQGWWQIQPRYRKDWSTCFVNVRDDNGGIHNMEAGQTSWTIVLTQEDIDELHGSGWAFSGCNLTIQSMEYELNK